MNEPNGISQQDKKSGGGAARGSTLLLTNITKLAGLVIALHEALGKDHAQAVVLAVAATFVLGAQVAENVLIRAIDRFFDKQ